MDDLAAQQGQVTLQAPGLFHGSGEEIAGENGDVGLLAGFQSAQAVVAVQVFLLI